MRVAHNVRCNVVIWYKNPVTGKWGKPYLGFVAPHTEAECKGYIKQWKIEDDADKHVYRYLLVHCPGQ
jgi:hypothetical protein